MAWYFCPVLRDALVFYAGSYNYGADVRYSLATYPPLMIWAAWAWRGCYPVRAGATGNAGADGG